MKIDNSPACVRKSSAPKLFLHGWSSGFPGYEIAYFVKPNSVVQMSVKYTPTDYNNGISEPYHLYSRAYSKDSYMTDKINVIAHPDVISQNHDATVSYSVKILPGTKGVYWLSLDNSCGLVPIVSDIDVQNVTKTDIQSPATGWRCPVSMMQYHLTDVSNAIIGLVHD
jgi:hypothetical protein